MTASTSSRARRGAPSPSRLLLAVVLLTGLAVACTREDEKGVDVEVPRAGAPGGGVEDAPAAREAPGELPGSGAEAAQPDAGKAAAPPAAEGEVPAPSDPPDASAGQALYAQYCASCHGPKGAGDGPIAATLQPKPAAHSDGAYMNGLTNAHVFTVIKYGGPAVGKSPLMAPWGGTLSDDQIWDLVAYVRSLAQPPYPGSVP